MAEKEEEKYVFLLTAQQSADIFASLVMTGTSLMGTKQHDHAEARDRGSGLLDFAIEWNDMFQQQRPQPNAPTTETPQ